MNVIKTIWVLPLLGILAAPAVAHDRGGDHRHHNRIEQRLDRQDYRIDRGVRNGELTRREAKRLRKQQRRIARLGQRFTHDGYLDRHERARLRHKLDRVSDRIHRFKHNDRQRGHHRDRHREKEFAADRRDRYRGGQDRYRVGHEGRGGYGSSHRQNDSGWGVVLRMSDYF